MTEEFDPEKYLAGSGTKTSASFDPDKFLSIGNPNYLDEAHPDITFKDRFIAKNFSQSPKVTVNYLTKKYPDHEAVVRNGSVFFKKKSEESYKRLDPSHFEMEDITDVIASDLPLGVAEGLATVKGAAVGAALGGIPGAFAGGALAAGAAGAGAETLRQGAGAALGLPQDIDPADVAFSGGLGAALAPLMGVGKVPGLKKSAQATVEGVFKNKAMAKLRSLATGMKKSETRDTLRNLLTDTTKLGVDTRNLIADTAYEAVEKGLVPHVGGTAIKKATEVAAHNISGAKGSILRRLVDRPRQVNNILEGGYTTDFANDKLMDAYEKVEKEYYDAGKAIGEKFRRSGKQIDISTIKKPILARIDEINNMKKTASPPSPDQLEEAAQLEDVYKEVFFRPQTTTKEVATNEIDQITGARKMVLEESTEMGAMPDLVDAEDAFQIKQSLARRAKFFTDKFAQKKRVTDDIVAGTVRKAGKRVNPAVKEQVKDLPELNKRFSKSVHDVEYFKKHFQNTKKNTPDIDEDAYNKKGYDALVKIGAGRDQNLTKKVRYLDKKYNLNIEESAKDMVAADLKGSAMGMPISSERVTATARLISGASAGGALGAFAGASSGVEHGKYLGGAGGFALGALAGSPAAFKKYMQLQRMSGKLAAPLKQPVIRQPLVEMLKNNNEN